jgi:hypothetical protein
MALGQYTKGRTSRDIILKGKISWHNLVLPDDDQALKCTIYPTAESLAEINKLKEEGLLNVLRKDEEGYNMTFKRVLVKKIRGKDVHFGPLIVLDKNGVPTEGMGIGHGSDVTLKLQVYEYNRPIGQGKGKGIAARLEAVRIDNLIPYVRDRDMNTLQVRQSKGLVEAAPEPIF